MDWATFGRYQPLDLLKRDDLGEVWRAYDTEAGRMVALRIVAPELVDSDGFEEQFYREVNSAQGVHDPHLVPIHHAGDVDGRLYVDSMLTEGRYVGDMLQSGPLTPAVAVSVVEQIGAALAAIHRAGLAHGRVSPSAIVVTPYSYAYLTDFGVGPDLAQDAEADIAALAGVLRECLGAHPISPDLSAVIARGVDARYDRVGEFVRDVVAAVPAAVPNPQWVPVAPDEPKRSSKAATWVVVGVTAVVIVTAVAIVAVLLRTDSSPTRTEATSSEPQDSPTSIRVASDNLVVDEAGEPKVVLSLYEDYTCPHCRAFEEENAAAIDDLIETGDVAVDYYPVAILDQPSDGYSSLAGGAAFCVADESVDAFRRFHKLLYQNQPDEMSSTFPTEADLVELARQAGAADESTVDCIESGDYVPLVQDMASDEDILATPTVLINGDEFIWTGAPNELRDAVEAAIG